MNLFKLRTLASYIQIMKEELEEAMSLQMPKEDHQEDLLEENHSTHQDRNLGITPKEEELQEIEAILMMKNGVMMVITLKIQTTKSEIFTPSSNMLWKATWGPPIEVKTSIFMISWWTCSSSVMKDHVMSLSSVDTRTEKETSGEIVGEFLDMHYQARRFDNWKKNSPLTSRIQTII